MSDPTVQQHDDADDQAGSASPITVDIPESLASMRQSPGEAEAYIAKWAASIRASFGRNRKDFNFAVCDALAAAGIQPTGRKVLSIGAWGQSASVMGDVSDWYSTLAARLRSVESSIPLPARRHANALLDQLFALATDQASKALEERLQPLQAELNSAKNALNNALDGERLQKLRAEGLEVDIDALKAEISHRGELLADVNDKLTVSHQLHLRLNEEIAGLKADKIMLMQQLESEKSRGREALSDAKEGFARELLHAQTTAEAERRRLMLASDSEKVEHAKKLAAERAENQKVLQAAMDELAKTRDQLESVRQDLSNASVLAATTRAELEGARALLTTERAHFAERERFYASDEYRQTSLLEFAEQARKAGFVLQSSPGSEGQPGEAADVAKTIGSGTAASARNLK